VHGYRLSLDSCERLVARLGDLSVAQRRELAGLHPDRAPSIVAGAGILLESMRAFGLGEIEVSETDILHGAALTAALE
jgi:exopolyphosphatase / guanosine-5'-triphosphate,3'-diphosphate pyrophosphatase